MFSDINDVSQLYVRRQELIKAGKPAKAVNSAFNTRKRELSERAYDFHEVPYDTIYIKKRTKFGVYPILGSSESPNVLLIQQDGVFL